MVWTAPHSVSPIRGRLSVPGSKSETNRALLLAALADGPSRITGGLASRDSALMLTALETFGVKVIQDETVLVDPPDSFHSTAPIHCGLAGTVMRFLPPVAALCDSSTTFVGDPQASARPMKPVLDVMRALGARIDSDSLPLSLTPPISWGRRAEIDASASSQFISGPLLSAARFPMGLELRHTGKVLPSRPHIEMSVQMLRSRGVQISQPDENTWQVDPGTIRARDETIAPDLTNAAVFLAAGLLTAGQVSIPNWPAETTQPGALFLDLVTGFGGRVERNGDMVTVTGDGRLTGSDIDLSSASELTPVVAAVAMFASGTTIIRGVGHIRGHETDRLAALTREFRAVGGDVAPTEDGLRITGGKKLSAHRFETYADHRMAHAGALIGLMVPGTTLTDVTCTSKTMPTFPTDWERLCGA